MESIWQLNVNKIKNGTQENETSSRVWVSYSLALIFAFKSILFCQNLQLANEEEAFIYRRTVMWQDSMDNIVTWALINADKAESTPVHQSFISFVDIHANHFFVR